MQNLFKNVVILSALSLLGCGGSGSGGGGATTTAPVSTGPVLTASATSLTFSGKQFAEIAPAQRVNLTYDRDVVSIVSITLTGDAKVDGRNVFSTSSDSSNLFADVMAVETDIEGGTYMDTLVFEPQLRAGGFGNTITVDLTLVQEATQPLTAKIDDPADLSVAITEGGPPVRISASVTTGNTINWEVQPLGFTADNGVDAVTTDPAMGTGSEQIDVVITPTPTLVNSIKANGPELVLFGFQDIDHPGNFTELDFEVTLTE